MVCLHVGRYGTCPTSVGGTSLASLGLVPSLWDMSLSCLSVRACMRVCGCNVCACATNTTPCTTMLFLWYSNIHCPVDVGQRPMTFTAIIMRLQMLLLLLRSPLVFTRVIITPLQPPLQLFTVRCVPVGVTSKTPQRDNCVLSRGFGMPRECWGFPIMLAMSWVEGNNPVNDMLRRCLNRAWSPHAVSLRTH